MDIIIDTDMGADDTFCIAKFLLMHKKGLCNIIGITTVCGNVPSHIGYLVLKHLLDNVFKVSIPIYKSRFSIENSYSYYYGKDGHFGKFDIDENNIIHKINDMDSANFLSKTINSDVSLVAIGPCTNLRICEERNPGILNKAKAIYIMGGVFEMNGNIMNTHEFNFHFDGFSSKVIMDKLNNIVLFPLDTTVNYQFDREYLLNLIPNDSKKLFQEICDKFYEVNKTNDEFILKSNNHIVVHDLLIAEFLNDNSKFVLVDKKINISKCGLIKYSNKGNQIKIAILKNEN